MSDTPRRVRLFLDTGVIIAGCIAHWGAAKVVLTLCAYPRQYVAIIAEDVERALLITTYRRRDGAKKVRDVR